jgi:hypothetical protein
MMHGCGRTDHGSSMTKWPNMIRNEDHLDDMSGPGIDSMQGCQEGVDR